MSLVKVLFISVFLIQNLNSQPIPVSSDSCSSFSAKSTVTLVEGKGARVEIEASGGKAPYKYFIYKESGHLVSMDFDKNWVEGLKSGKYACTVSDSNNCKKTIDIDIE
jgi:hypothetical protein